MESSGESLGERRGPCWPALTRPCKEGCRAVERANQSVCRNSLLNSGGGGIRTRGTLAGPPVFKTGAFDHSATPPWRADDPSCAVTRTRCSEDLLYTATNPGRGGRVAEGTRLLSEYGGQTPSRVRIPPSPSPYSLQKRHFRYGMGRAKCAEAACSFAQMEAFWKQALQNRMEFDPRSAVHRARCGRWRTRVENV